jgi:hypothetical protein
MLLAAAISPDNTPHGYNLTFAFPMLMFIIIATALYLRFRGSHRVPGHVALTSTRWANPKPGNEAQSQALAAEPVTASADRGPASVAHGATLEAEAGDTTSGSTLHEGTADDGTPQSTAQESTAKESTEDGE